MTLFVHGIFANLPDVAPDSPEFTSGIEAKTAPSAAEKEKSPASDKEKPLLPKNSSPAEALPGLPMPGLSSMPAVGSRVRDKLSGQEGTVQAPPPGDYGSIVFVKNDADSQVHPVLSDFLEAVPNAMPPVAPMADAPAAIQPAPDSPIPVSDPLKPKASSTRPIYRAWLAKTKGSKIVAKGGKEKKSLLEKWERAENYGGEDYSNCYVGLSKHRDSDTIERANFDAMLQKLGGENEEEGVIVGHFGHWAVGWVEQILVREDSPKVAELEKLMAAYEEYPIVDEDLLSQYEMEKENEDWDSWAKSDVESDLVELGKLEEGQKFEELEPELAEAIKEAYQEAWGNSGGDLGDTKKFVEATVSKWDASKGTREVQQKEAEGQQRLPNIASLRARLAKSQAKVLANKPASVSTAPAVERDFLVTAAGDERKLLYSAFLVKVKALKEMSHAAVLDVIGYIPENWDLLVARLMQDGILLKSKMEKFDVAAFVRKGFSQPEIRLMLGRQGVPMYALDKAFKVIANGLKADTPNNRVPIRKWKSTKKSRERIDQAFDKKVNELKEKEAAAAKAEKEVATPDIKADKPSKPKPATDPGQGMVWAWDPSTQDWYETPVTA